MAPMKRMLNSLKPSSSKSHPAGKEEVHAKKEETEEVKPEKDGMITS